MHTEIIEIQCRDIEGKFTLKNLISALGAFQ